MKNIIIFSAFFLLIISCGNDSTEGPDKIYFGEDTCERCKMIISEKLFASQYKTSEGDTKKYDDLGCMIEDIMSSEDKVIGKFSIFVVDYNTGKWVDAEKAYFVLSESVKTPMGHGILAFNNIQSAQKFMTGKDKLLGQFESAKLFLSQ